MMDRCTSLHSALEDLGEGVGLGRIDTVRCLLNAGLDADEAARCEPGTSMLMLACLHRQAKVAELLIEGGAESDFLGHQTNRALTLTCVHGDVHVASLLLRGRADANSLDRKGASPLMTSSHLGYSGITRLLLQSRADAWSWDAEGMTALMLACAGGHAEVVRQLIDAEASVNAWADQGMTPLMFVANRGLLSTTPVFYGVGGNDRICFELGHVECAILLLFRSARIDDRDIFDRAAFMFASVNNDLDMVGLLLGFRAEVDSCTDLGWTSLCAACCLGRAEVVGLLLEARADANRC